MHTHTYLHTEINARIWLTRSAYAGNMDAEYEVVVLKEKTEGIGVCMSVYMYVYGKYGCQV